MKSDDFDVVSPIVVSKNRSPSNIVFRFSNYSVSMLSCILVGEAYLAKVMQSIAFLIQNVKAMKEPFTRIGQFFC